jgi:hypothetical protein
MNTYRAVIKRIEVDHEVVELDADSTAHAIARLDDYVARGRSKSVRVITPFDADPKSSSFSTVAKIELKS